MSNVTNASNLNDAATNLAEVAQYHFTRLVGLDSIASGTGGTGVSTAIGEPPTVIQRPWLQMPEGGVPFDKQTAVVMPVVGVTATVVSITVPDGMDGVINAFSWNDTGGGFVQGSGDLVAQVLRNSAAIRNFENILVEKGTIQQPRTISPIRIFSQQVISITINHVANGLLSGNIVGCLQGYFYPNKG